MTDPIQEPLDMPTERVTDESPHHTDAAQDAEDAAGAVLRCIGRMDVAHEVVRATNTRLLALLRAFIEDHYERGSGITDEQIAAAEAELAAHDDSDTGGGT